MELRREIPRPAIFPFLPLLIPAPLGALKGRGAEAGPDHPRNYVATFTASKKKKNTRKAL